MNYLLAFLFAGVVCLIAQIILDNTKLLPGHITAIFVVVGSLLDIFSIYDKFVDIFGGGAIVCITSFGHLLTHAALEGLHSDGFIGIFSNMFSLTSAGIVAVIVFSFIFTLMFKARD